MSESSTAAGETPSFLRESRFRISNGESLFVHQIPSETRPVKGILFFGHGMVEHSGRYVEWGRYLARAGWSVYAADHRGHGRSDGPRLWVDHYSDYVDDFCSLAEAGASEWPELPIFIAGMSMGGGIAIQAAVRLQETLPRFSGTVLIAPGLAVDPHIFPILRRFVLILDHLIPRFRPVYPSFRRLTKSEEILNEFRHDPCVCRCRIPIHFGAENLRALSDGFRAASKLSKPILICQGTDDQIVYPPRITELFNEIPIQDKKLNIYDGVGHDVIHEKEGKVSWNDILTWLDQHLPQN